VPTIDHTGNIAGNAYLSALLQRRLALLDPARYGDVVPTSFDTGGGALMAVPYWEAGDFDPPPEMHAKWFAWAGVPMRNGFVRPPWAKILGNEGGRAWYDTQDAFESDLGRLLALMVDDRAVVCPDAHLDELRAALAASRLTPAEQQRVFPLLRNDSAWWPILQLAKSGQYDLLVLYGPFASAGVVLPRSQPYVCFEHGTLRYVPCLREEIDVLLALSYQHADHVLITNADCLDAARTLGLDPARTSWTAHPVDETRFVPGPAPDNDPLVFFCPARSGFLLKGTDKLLYGFRQYVQGMESGRLPRAVMHLIAGGDDVLETQRLVASLGLAEHVRWLGALPKCALLRAYQHADVVLDQFSQLIGSYGTITVEALACGKPVVTWVDAAKHQALGAASPHEVVCLAKRADEIGAWLGRLAQSPRLRADVGAAGRAWVEQHHGWRAGATQAIRVYREVLGSP